MKVQAIERKYIIGDALYGDNFSLEEIMQWFEDEREGYANIVRKKSGAYTYPYHELDYKCCFSYLPEDFDQIRVLGLGSAYGQEFKPIIKRIKQIDIIETSPLFFSAQVDGTPVTYKKAQPSGIIGFDDNTFDLVLCFSVFHHIPNVAFVLKEITRVLKTGGYLLHRDPIVAMRYPLQTINDFKRPMPGLTPRERGIPLKYFRRRFESLGLVTIKETLCGMPTTARAAKLFGVRTPFNSKYWTRIDLLTSILFSWNLQYRKALPKYLSFYPQMVCNILRKGQF